MGVEACEVYFRTWNWVKWLVYGLTLTFNLAVSHPMYSQLYKSAEGISQNIIELNSPTIDYLYKNLDPANISDAFREDDGNLEMESRFRKKDANFFKPVIQLFIQKGGQTEFAAFKKLFISMITDSSEDANSDICTFCHGGFGAIQAGIKMAKDPKMIEHNLKAMEMDGLILPIVDAIRKAKGMPAKDMCNYLMCGKIVGDLPNIKNIQPNQPLQHPTKMEKRQSYYKVLHLADIHIDPLYEENQQIKCEKTVCCRKSKSKPTSKKDKSNYWGTISRSCDVPQRLVENAMKSIKATHKDIDYIIWTGDAVPHDFQDQTAKISSEALDRINNLFKTFFPKHRVFSSLGNHEGIPTNNFAPPETSNSSSWLYKKVKQLWTPGIKDKNVKFGNAGFYSTKLYDGLRLISLNMNFCYFFNWWIIFKQIDPADELRWLHKELTSAEKNRERVHIIGHIPPGLKDCVATWSNIYFKIIKQFSKIVTAQFFGHTHLDEFQVFKENNVPFSIAYIAPSITTYGSVNPAYRIYYIDKKSKMVTNHETWTTDLNKYQRKKDTPKWTSLYNAKKHYGLKDLSPSSWDKLVTNMKKDQKLFQKFHRAQYRHKDVPKCGKRCVSAKLCLLRSGKSFNEKFCN